ncbi:MAG: OAM dimerization domain-containing protein [Bacilli bacterium]|jgi:beta-lysine 5,6-aminomutase beta subunit|nr:OAM dimerization domain-containing protein [Bacilli bacterium]
MKIRPYGDTLHDGKIQLSFSLPTPLSEVAVEAAKQVAENLGLVDVSVVHSEKMGTDFSFFIVYGTFTKQIDLDLITVQSVKTIVLSREEIEEKIRQEVKKELVFIGASTGSDAHTVGIDAIMNMKGFAGHYGLERYAGIKAINLGSQVSNEELIKQAKIHQADVILVSQTVTQKDVHIKNMVELIEMLEAEHIRKQYIVVCGGARITHELAKELGYDAGFGPNKFAEDVASYAVDEWLTRNTGK